MSRFDQGLRTIGDVLGCLAGEHTQTMADLQAMRERFQASEQKPEVQKKLEVAVSTLDRRDKQIIELKLQVKHLRDDLGKTRASNTAFSKRIAELETRAEEFKKNPLKAIAAPAAEAAR